MSVVLDTAAQLLLKTGASKVIASSAVFGFAGLHSGWVWLGMVTLVASLAIWLYSLRYVPLNIASNLTATVHVLVPLSCWWLLHENISPGRWLGIAMVITGVFIVVRPARQAEEKMEGRL